MKTVLVTGGAGYIGSHAVVELLDQGYHVIVIDSLENGFLDVIDSRCKFYQGNLQDLPFLEQIFQQNSIDCVMHFAAYIKIPESINNPNKYYSNNVYSTLCLLKIMQKYQVNKIIFSSTAAVYGEIQENRKVTEDFPTNPINPYGKSKLMAEEIIQDHAKVSPLCYAIFR
ncbi:MAG: GDP-mannose 4,6-dehydratase, partial [Fusobacterium necrophorum]|nr:GDP-mannose 4,6-dehydratase [Fusobacterium necrophorum]